MKFGIVGGTFNPIHNGHLAIAKLTLEKLQLQAVYLTPASNPPHKKQTELAPFHHRLEMIRLAINKDPQLLCSELDSTGEEFSYTKHLIQRFKKQLPDADIYFIIGADNLSQLKNWYDSDWILRNVTIVAVNRTQMGSKEPNQEAEQLAADICLEYLDNNNVTESAHTKTPASNQMIKVTANAKAPIDISSNLLRKETVNTSSPIKMSSSLFGKETTPANPTIFLDMPPIDISSSQLRKMIAAGKDISAFVPPPVLEYIGKNRLYQR